MFDSEDEDDIEEFDLTLWDGPPGILMDQMSHAGPYDGADIFGFIWEEEPTDFMTIDALKEFAVNLVRFIDMYESGTLEGTEDEEDHD